jgi:hypothetical protein
VNVDTGEMAAFTEELDELGREVADHGYRTDRLSEVLVQLIELVTPVLKRAVEREREHAETHRARHHHDAGRHRRGRTPPWCEL